jgi:putative peptidoglycan lipid II flippase
VALLVFAQPLVATLFHYGAFKDSDVLQVSIALAGYGVGLMGLVAIKVLAPGYYASQDMRTPMRIAVAVLVLTQVMNVALVPLLQHAGLALSIGVGALVNAAGCWSGLLRRGSYKPSRAGAVRCCRCWRHRAAHGLPAVGRAQVFVDRPARAAAGTRGGLLAAMLAGAALHLLRRALWRPG